MPTNQAINMKDLLSNPNRSVSNSRRRSLMNARHFRSDLSKAYKRYKNWHSASKVANYYGITQRTVLITFHKYHLPVQKSVMANLGKTNNVRRHYKEAFAYYKRTHLIRRVAAHYHVSNTTIRNVFNEHHLPTNLGHQYQRELIDQADGKNTSELSDKSNLRHALLDMHKYKLLSDSAKLHSPLSISKIAKKYGISRPVLYREYHAKYDNSSSNNELTSEIINLVSSKFNQKIKPYKNKIKVLESKNKHLEDKLDKNNDKSILTLLKERL